jgi:putative methanogenesis marker protein 8
MKRGVKKDLHILRYCSSLVSVSFGKVVYVSMPRIDFCPMARRFYKDIIKKDINKKQQQKAIKKIIEFKIKRFGFFTDKRSFSLQRTQVPFGASEMLMRALENKIIDAAVIVCDGAGTVITDSAKALQGIGARMHNIVMTSPIDKVMRKLDSLGCFVLSKDALIDQLLGVRKAIDLGYKSIGVTLNSSSALKLESLRAIEKVKAVKITALITCTSGIREGAVVKIKRYGDLVWSCSSKEVRMLIAPIAKKQLSELMPVYVISKKGLKFATASDNILKKRR